MAARHSSGGNDTVRESARKGWPPWLCETVQSVHAAVDRAETKAELGTALPDTLIDCAGVAFSWVGTASTSPIRVRSSPSERSLPSTLPVEPAETLTERVESSGAVRTVTEAVPSDVRYALEHTGLNATEIEMSVGVSLEHDTEQYGVLHLALTASAPADASVLESLGRAVGRQLHLFDATEQLARERCRLESLRSLISHDLRNPLNIASGRVELARMDDDTSHLDPVTAAFDRIDSLADRGVRLVEAGHQPEGQRVLSIAALARDCWGDVGQARGELTVEETTVIGDRDRVRMLLNELFRNAFDHIEGGVTVEVGPLSGADGFYVADDGPGIPDDDREFVLDAGYTTAPDREGVGLSVVTEAAGAHGWDVTLDAPGKGGTRVEIVTSRW